MDQQFQNTALQLNAQWDAAFNAQQAEQVTAFYDDAASVMPSGGPQLSGLEQIGRFWADLIAQGVIDHHIELIEATADAGLAYQRGKWSAAVIDAEGERQTFGGSLQLVYRRQGDGSWKVLSHIWNM
jgi:ketosteroid isomerase-like protein